MVAFMAFATIWGACKKEGVSSSVRKFDMSIDKIPVTIPVSAATGSMATITTFQHRLNLDSLVRSIRSTYTRANLKSLTLRSCVMTIKDETIANSLGNFSMLQADCVAPDNRLYPLASVVAIKDTVLFSVTLTKGVSQELGSMFPKDTITYVLSGNLRKALTANLTADARLIYDVTVSE